MSIRDIVEKIKGPSSNRVASLRAWLGEWEKDIFIILLIILTAVLAFGLGRLTKLEENRVPVRVIEPATLPITESNNTTNTSEAPGPATGKYVGSKSGTKYHFPWCPSAVTIKEGNKVWFATKEEAESAGYSPAQNCPGL